MDVLLYGDTERYAWVIDALQGRLDQEPQLRVVLRRLAKAGPTMRKEVPLWVLVGPFSTSRPNAKITKSMDQELDGTAITRGMYIECVVAVTVTLTLWYYK